MKLGERYSLVSFSAYYDVVFVRTPLTGYRRVRGGLEIASVCNYNVIT